MASKMGDRGGAREGRKKSLNSVKKTKFKQEKDYFKDKVEQVITTSKYSLPSPPVNDLIENDDDEDSESKDQSTSQSAKPVEALPAHELLVDSGAHLLSRQFDRDLQSIVRRANNQGIRCLVATLPDYNRASELLTLCQSYSSTIYCSLGISSDTVKKGADRLFEKLMSQLTNDVMSPYCVAVAASLDWTRETATHFTQLKLLTGQIELAVKVRLPVVIREKAASEKVIEAVQTVKQNMSAEDVAEWQFRYAIAGFSGSDRELSAYVENGFYVMLNGQICDTKRVDPSTIVASATQSKKKPVRDDIEDDLAVNLDSSSLLPELTGEGAQLFKQIRAGYLPITQLLIASDAPLFTPQNLRDAHERSQRNEPSTLTAVYEVIAEAYQIPVEDAIKQITQNSLAFYQLTLKSQTLNQASQTAVDELTNKVKKLGTESGSDGSDSDDDEDDEKGESKAKKPANKSSKPAKKAKSRARMLGAEVNVGSLEDDDLVRYACKRCRTILFTALDVVPHASASDGQQTDASALPANTNKKGKQILDPSDFTQCESLFIRPMKWMSNLAFPTHASSNEPLAVLVNNDRVECFSCSAKLGRCGMIAQYLPCSCGRSASGPPPYFSIALSRVDLIVHLSEYKAPRSMSDELDAIKDQSVKQDEQAQKQKKEAAKLRKDKKKQKQQFDDVRGNFTEYRNNGLRRVKNKADSDEDD